MTFKVLEPYLRYLVLNWDFKKNSNKIKIIYFGIPGSIGILKLIANNLKIKLKLLDFKNKIYAIKN